MKLFFYFFLLKTFLVRSSDLNCTLYTYTTSLVRVLEISVMDTAGNDGLLLQGRLLFSPSPQRNMPHFNQNYLQSQSPPTHLALLPANTNVIIKVCTILSRPSTDCCSTTFNWPNNDEMCACNVQFASAKCVRMFSFSVMMVFFFHFFPQDNDVRIIIGQFDENLASKVFCCVSVDNVIVS